jgi:alpha-beta hydrolase superfamily lysophospholipase
MSRRLVPLLLAAALAAAVPTAAEAATPRTGPAGDAFYTPPSPLPGKRHGDLIWTRPLKGAAVVPGAAKTALVLYRSSGAGGGAVPVSGVVSIPKGKAPKGGWPVVTYAHGTTGIADSCAPSRDVAGTPVHPYNNYVFPLLQRWLKAGYAVVRTDYEGLGTPGVHPYLVGSSEGPGVLDIVRAARQLDPDVSRSVAIAGHSQGGHAALFAAALAKKYTPDLNVRGTVAFAPASHIDNQIPLTTILTNPGGGLSGIVSLIVRGIAAAVPSLDTTGLLSEKGSALYPETLDACLPELSAPDAFGGLAPADIFVAKPDFTAAAKALDAQDPSHLKISTPVLIEQGTADTTVLPLFTDQLDKELRANGVKLTYKKYAGVDHGGVVVRPTPQADAAKWVEQKLG